MQCENLWAVAHGIGQDSSKHDESHCLELSRRTSVTFSQLQCVTYRMTSVV